MTNNNALIMAMSRQELNGDSLYLIGSMSVARKKQLNTELSDVDLALTPLRKKTLKDFDKSLNNALSLKQSLSGEHVRDIEIFFMSSFVRSVYFSLLSCLAGARRPHPDDFFSKEDVFTALSVSNDFKQILYKYAAQEFLETYSQKLPYSDTTESRKVAKEVLRGMKFIICATAKEDIEELENELFKINDFTNLLSKASHLGVILPPILPLFEECLAGKSIEDWSEWMVRQESLAKQFLKMQNEEKTDTSNSDQRFYEAFLKARNMLIVGVKDIINECNIQRRSEMMGDFADRAVEVIVKLALNGVGSLEDFGSFEPESTMELSYQVLIKHLQSRREDTECFAAAILLLEHALRQAIEMKVD